MTKRYVYSTCVLVAMTAASCSQGRGASSNVATPDAFGTTTGELACDEYLSLARACIDKGRWGASTQRRAELVVVDRLLREAAQGAPTALDRVAVWASALEADHAKKLASHGDPARLTSHSASLELPPPRELGKSGIDQLPLDCQ